MEKLVEYLRRNKLYYIGGVSFNIGVAYIHIDSFKMNNMESECHIWIYFKDRLIKVVFNNTISKISQFPRESNDQAGKWQQISIPESIISDYVSMIIEAISTRINVGIVLGDIDSWRKLDILLCKIE